MATVLANAQLIAGIRAGLRAAADPSRAPQMQAYMKSAMPYLGVPVPQVRAIVRAQIRPRPPASADMLRDTVLLLWHEAGFREERYAAAALTGVPAARRLSTPELVTLYEELIVSGAWWDHVDEISHPCRGPAARVPGRDRPGRSRVATPPRSLAARPP